jgi:DNA-binding response OmpR family regulator
MNTGAVLIVDDSLTVRMDLMDAFNAEGLAAIGCESLAAARAALAEHDIGLIVLDVLLPDGSGIDLVRELRAQSNGNALPILMLSTEVEVRDRVRGLMTGSDDYIGKPYDRDHLVARAGELLRRRSGGAAPAERATVLVIDDSATFRAELTHALEQHGYAVIGAASGEEGLRSAALQRPNAIIVDGVLPGMDGATVVRKLRLDAALRQTPCVMLTGSTIDRSAELNALDSGADAFVRKEDNMELVLARLAATLRGGSEADTDRETESLLAPKKILAVDDSATYREELAEMLRADGYDVIPARSGEEALEMLAAQPVDCILLDRLMPGLGGTESCRRIKASAATRDIPLIMLTASEDRAAMIEGLSTGADDYVLKSSDAEVLKARVRAQLRRKQIEDESRRIRVRLLRKELETAEARAMAELAETRAALVGELEQKAAALTQANKELEAFSYSVSHDLRSPLRAIDGYSRILLEDYGQTIEASGRDCLERVRRAAQRMSQLIDDLLMLSRVSRMEAVREPVDLGALVHDIANTLCGQEPARRVQLEVAAGLTASGDPRLLRIALENLLGNAWKFTGTHPEPRIEFGATLDAEEPAYFVRDNGAGFDMRYAGKLFAPFQRLHTDDQFPGTGIGLATVQRVIQKHGGRIWVEAAPDRGATFYFTLA